MKFLSSLILLVVLASCRPAVFAQNTGPFDLITYTNIADLLARGSTKSANKAAQVLGYYQPGDGGGGLFYATNTAAGPNLGMRFQSVLTPGTAFDRIYTGGDETIDVRTFGARPSTGNDDTLNLQAALDYAATVTKAVLVPQGNYRVGRLVLKAPIVGAGDGSIVEPTDPLVITNSNISVKNLQVRSFSTLSMYTTNIAMTNIAIENCLFTYDPSVVFIPNPTNYLMFLDYKILESSITEGLRICNNRIYRGGVQLSRANNLLFQGNYINGEYLNWNELLHCSQFSRAIIADNVFLNSAADPLDLYSSGSGCRVVNNLFDGWGDPAATNAPGFNEAAITMKLILTDNANSSGPVLGFTENTVVSGNTFRNGRPTADDSRYFGIMLKMEDLRTNAPAVWNPTNASRNVIVSHNIFDGFWTNNIHSYANIRFAGVHVDGTGIDVSHNIFRDISMQQDGLSASGTAGVELGFNFGTANGTAAIGCLVSHNIYEGEGSGIIIFNATNCVIEANIVQQDYAFYTNRPDLKPRYGMVIFGNMSQCVVRDNQFDPTFLNPAGFIQLGSTNYIDDCLFVGNMTTKKLPLTWVFPRVRFSSFVNNMMGPLDFGTEGVIQYGNSLIGNSVSGNVSLPGFDIHGQQSFQIVGNKFTNTIRAINLHGGTSTTDTAAGLIHDNFSLNEGSTFLDVGNCSAASLLTIIRFNNFANNVLRTSGGTMNLGGQVNVGSLISAGVVQVPAGVQFRWSNGTSLLSSSDGFINLFNNAGTGFSGLNFGGNSVNDIGIFRTATGFHFKNGTSALYTNIWAKNAVFGDIAANVGQLVAVGAGGFLTTTTGSGYNAIWDEGLALSARTIINFVGAGVTATDDGTKTVVTIPGGDGVGYATVQNEGSPLTARGTINFIGPYINAVDNSGSGRTDVTITNGLRHIVLALTDPSIAVTAPKTNWLTLPEALTITGVKGRLLYAGSTDTVIALYNGGGVTPITTITLTSGQTNVAGTLTGTSISADAALVGVVTTAGTTAKGAQLVISYTIP